MNKGQIQLGILGTIVALIAGIGTPFIWGGNIKAVNDVQNVKIQTLEQSTAETRGELKELNKKLNALLIKSGIDPDKIK